MVIRKLPGKRQWRLTSKTSGRNLGTYPTRAGAVARERQVQFFKFRAARFSKRK
jgi:hypothetical protein